MSEMRPFNSPLECGLRVLFVLNSAQGRTADLQRLIAYDYLLVHSGDVDGPDSLHPSVPYRGTEFLVKRDVIGIGLNEMFSRELLDKTFDAAGILYRSTELTTAFVSLLKSEYANSLRERADWVVERFGDMKDVELSAFMTESIGKWGAEFERLSAINELEL